jgi:hypothetical protein
MIGWIIALLEIPMLPVRSFFCFALALTVVLSLEPLAIADYACDALSLNIATVANNPFSADEVSTSWQIGPDGSKTQISVRVVAQIARDNTGRVVVKRPAHFSSNEAQEKNQPDFWYRTICDPAGSRTDIGQDVHFRVAPDPSTGKNVQTVLRVDGTAKVRRGLRRISPNEFDEFLVSPSDKHEDLGYKDSNGIRAHGYRRWRASDGILDEARFTDQWVSADLASGLSRIDTTSATESRIEFTRLRRGEPDPKLFEIPPDYKVIYADGKSPATMP